jgi:hypothetical protein
LELCFSQQGERASPLPHRLELVRESSYCTSDVGVSIDERANFRSPKSGATFAQLDWVQLAVTAELVESGRADAQHCFGIVDRQ